MPKRRQAVKEPETVAQLQTPDADTSVSGKDAQYTIGIDLGGTNIKFGLVSADGRIVKRARIPTLAGAGPKRALRRIVGVLRRLSRDHDIACVGVGAAGLIDHENGVIRVPPNLPGWDGAPVKDTIEKALDIPCHVTNDVNACVLGELLFGAGVGKRDIFCLTLGTGVGGGLIADGKLVIGANGAAGEVGHTVIFPDGQMCRCGSRGCLECYVGADYVVQRTVARLRMQGTKLKSRSLIRRYSGNRAEAITPKLISRAAHHGDRLALEIAEEIGYYAGLGIVNVVQLLDPELIVVGGGISGFGKPLLESIRRTVDERVQEFPGRKLEVVLSKLADEAGVLGASRLGFQSPPPSGSHNLPDA
jgi:glucokinase